MEAGEVLPARHDNFPALIVNPSFDPSMSRGEIQSPQGEDVAKEVRARLGLMLGTVSF